MNYIDTDLWHKRAPGEITGSATAAGPLMNPKSMSYLPVFQKYMNAVLEKGVGFMEAPLAFLALSYFCMSY